MGLGLRLVEIGVEGPGGSADVLEIIRRRDLGDIAVLALSLSAKLLNRSNCHD